MTYRTIATLFLATVFLLRLMPAEAVERTKFDADAFAAAQRDNRAILIEVHAWWCPVCWMQKSAMSSIEKEPRFRNFTVFTVDFDQEKAILRQFNVQKQSTLVVFRGPTEVGRLVGESSAITISRLLQRGL